MLKDGKRDGMTRVFVKCVNYATAALSLMVFAGYPAMAGPPLGRSLNAMPGAPTVSGTVSLAATPYREQKPLPGMAIVHIELIDVSVKDIRTGTIGEETIWAAGGKLPVTFRIAYDPSRIDPRHAYAIRARIMEGEKLLFISSPYYVLTRGAPHTANAVVAPVR